MWNQLFLDEESVLELWRNFKYVQYCYPAVHRSSVFLPPAIRRMGEGNSFSLFTFRGGGGVPDPGLDGGGSQVSDFRGGPRSQIFGGGSQVSDFQGGYPVSVKGKIFDTRFGLIHVQTGEKNFCRGTPPPPVKGNFLTPDLAWYMFRLGKKIFVEGPPPPQVKGKIFDTRFGLIHVQTGEKNFCQGTLPPPPAQ